MKINKTNLYNNVSTYGSPSHKLRIREENSNGKLQQNRPAERASLCGSERLEDNSVSFKGNPKLVTNIAKDMLQQNSASKVSKFSNKMGGANWFKKLITVADTHETFFEAMTALVVAGMLKPICVLAMPGAEKEDKQMAATKNAVSAFIGFGLSNLILSPFSNGVNKILNSIDSKNPTQYIKNKDYVDKLLSEELHLIKKGKTAAENVYAKSTLNDAFKTTFKKIPDLAVSPLKASITIALVPYILKFLFGKDNKKEEKSLDNLTLMNTIKMKMQQNQNKETAFKGNQAEQNNEPAFTGGVSSIAKNKNIFSKAKDAYCDFLGKPLAKLIGSIAPTKAGQKITEISSRFDKPTARWSDLASCVITYFYVRNTQKSDKIEEERKFPLIANNIMVTIASSTAAFLIDKFTDKPMENLLKGYINKRSNELFEKSNKNIIENLKTALKDSSDSIDMEKLKHHADYLLDGVEIKGSLYNAIETLKNNEVVKKALKEKIIENDDIAKLVASGFEKQAQNVFKGISKAKSLTVFTLTVRFLVTVLMTPVIGRFVDFVKKKTGKEENKEAEQKNNQNAGMKDFMSALNN